MLIYFAEPPNLTWLNVTEEYFNVYRTHLGGFYKAPEGRIVDHNEVRRAAMYDKPYYDPNDKEFITDEARKFLFKTNDDWQSCKNILQKMKRTLVQVSCLCVFSKITIFQDIF